MAIKIVVAIVLALPLFALAATVLLGLTRQDQKNGKDKSASRRERLAQYKLLAAWPLIAGLIGWLIVNPTYALTTGDEIDVVLWLPVALNYWGFWLLIWLANHFKGLFKKTEIGKDLQASILRTLTVAVAVIVALPIWWPIIAGAVGIGGQLKQTTCGYDRGHWDCVVVYNYQSYPEEVLVVQPGWSVKFLPLDENQQRDRQSLSPCHNLYELNWYPRNDAPCGAVLYAFAPPGGISDILSQNWQVVSPADFGKELSIKGLDQTKRWALYLIANISWWSDCQEMRAIGENSEYCRNGNAIAFNPTKKTRLQGRLVVNLDINTYRY